MSDKHKAERYINLSGVAELLGVTRQRAYELKMLGKLPKPVGRFMGHDAWTPESIEAFRAERESAKDAVKKKAAKKKAIKKKAAKKGESR